VSRTIIIGDVHGCSEELLLLLRECEHAPSDTVVLVGDLVAKGPDSRGVLAIVRDLSALSVLGNHDARVLDHRLALEAGRTARPLRPDHAAVVAALDDRDFDLLASLPLYLRLPGDAGLVVHAGLVPGIPLDQQERDMLLNIRTIRPDGTGSRRPNEGVLWGSRWKGPEFVYFGHHAAQGLQRHPYALGLDTGCVYGRRLSAFVLPDKQLISVEARKTYTEVKGL
jgi:Calcineurin-like phosphoesterase